MRAAAGLVRPFDSAAATWLAIMKDKAVACLCMPDTICNSSLSAASAWAIRPPELVRPAGHCHATDLARI
jgi:hypothetical protein